MNSMIPVVAANRGMLLVSPTDDRVFVTDMYARRFLPIYDDPAFMDDEQVITTTHSFFQQSIDDDCSSDLTYTINVLLESIGQETVRQAVTKLLLALSQTGLSYLKIHFAVCPDDWTLVLSFIESIRSAATRGRIRVLLIGPFKRLDDGTKTSLTNLGVDLRLVAGWWRGCSRADYTRMNHDVLRDFAEFGFRIPFTLYIHADNVGSVRGLLESGLDANLQSGFSLPLIFYNPYHAFIDSCPPGPDETAYAGLVAEAYQEFPFFDDVFFPINELAYVVAHGGWSFRRNQPQLVQITIDIEGGIRTFRQIPAIGRLWQHCTYLLDLPFEQIASELIRFHKDQYDWGQNAFCGGCSWRFICGGVDAPNDKGQVPPGTLEAICGHRKLFLEAFVWERIRAQGLL